MFDALEQTGGDSARVWILAASKAEDEEKQEQMTIAIAERFNGGNAVCLK